MKDHVYKELEPKACFYCELTRIVLYIVLVAAVVALVKYL